MDDEHLAEIEDLKHRIASALRSAGFEDVALNGDDGDTGPAVRFYDAETQHECDLDPYPV